MTVKDQLKTVRNLHIQAIVFYVVCLALVLTTTTGTVILLTGSILLSGWQIRKLTRLMKSPFLFLEELRQKFADQ